MARKDNRGRNLRTGESQRKDGLYMYRYKDERTGRRLAVYSPDLAELRKKEKEIEKDQSEGILTDTQCKNMGSVKNFVALVKNGSFLVRITDMTILIEKEFIYGSSKRPNPTDYYRKQHYQCG